MSNRIPTGFTEATVDTDGAIIHYLRGGKGEPVVLLHGWPQTWHEWRLVMPLLAERYDVIVPSLRGVEGSRALDGQYDAATMAGDVRELLQSIGIERAFIVGHDIGMLVAHAFAVRFPAATTKLVIMEGVLIGLEPMTTEPPRGRFRSLLPRKPRQSWIGGPTRSMPYARSRAASFPLNSRREQSPAAPMR